MAQITDGIRDDAQFLNLKEISIDNVRDDIKAMMIEGERILHAFKTVRDQVVFTNLRVFVVNVQGLTGKKVAYYSYPYSKVQYFGIETAGVIDIDSELTMVFDDGMQLRFDFRSRFDIRGLCAVLSKHIL